MFAVKDRKQQPNKLASASKNSSKAPSDLQKRPLESFQLLQRSLGNQYLQALSRTVGQPDGLFRQRTCACGGYCASCMQREDDRRTIQTKLVVGASNDVYEQEADRTAERIMQMPEPSIQPQMEPEEEKSVSLSAQVGDSTNVIQRRNLGMTGACEFENCKNQLGNFFMIPEDTPPGFHPSGGASFRVNDVDGFWFRFHTPRDEWYKIPDISTAQVTCNNEDKEHPTISSIFGDWTNKGIHTPNPFQGAEATQEQEEELQRKPMEDEEKKKEEEETLQTKTASSKLPAVSSSLQNRIAALRGGGQPLPQSERNFFEPRFGADFSQVRVHTDNQAAEASRAVNARAFTLRRDVVFGAGQYQPRASEGRRLLAHELTHVVQQGGGLLRKLMVGEPGYLYEQEAERVGEQVMQMPFFLQQQTGKEEPGENQIQCQSEPTQAQEPSSTTASTASTGQAQGVGSVVEDLKSKIQDGKITFASDSKKKELLGENTGTKVTDLLQKLVLQLSELETIHISSIIRSAGFHGLGRAVDIGNEEIAGSLLPVIATDTKVEEIKIDEIIFDAAVANEEDHNKWNYDAGKKHNYPKSTLDEHKDHIHIAVQAG